MSVEIPADLSPFVDAVIRSGHYESEADVVAEALRLLKRREALAEEIRLGINQLDRGESVDGEQVCRVAGQGCRTQARSMSRRKCWGE